MNVKAIVGHPGTGKTHALATISEGLRRSGYAVFFSAFTRSVRDEARWRGIPDDDPHARTFAGWAYVALSRSVGQVVVGPDDAWSLFTRAASRLGIRCTRNPWLVGRTRCGRAMWLMHLAIHVAGPDWLNLLNRIDEAVTKLAEEYLAELGPRLDLDLAMLEAATGNVEPPWRSRRKIAVVVDEAQDLSPLMWCILKRWANPELPAPKWCGDPLAEADRLILAGDPNQSIFETLNGADPGMFVRVSGLSDVEVLRISRRVPRSVYRVFAKPLLDIIGNPYAEYYPKPENGVATIEYSEDPVEAAANLAIEASRLGLEVGVVTNTNTTALEVLLALLKRGARPCTLKHPPDRELSCVDRRGIIVDTVFAWKGLETDVVIYIPDASGADEPQLTRMAYVAVTRARHATVVVCGRGTDRRVVGKTC